jgi:beta-glucosidase
MSLEQKVGQMIQAEIQSATPEDVRRYFLGSILNGGGSFPANRRDASVGDWLALAQRYHEASLSVNASVGVPLIWGTDAVHGHNNVRGATLFPHNIGLGAANDTDLVERIGVATAREVLATGIDWTFAPTLAVAKDPRWGRTYESYSDDPVIVARLGRAMVRGLQGRLSQESTLPEGQVIATAKHFIGDGATANGIDQGDVVIPREELISTHGAGYVTTLAEGVQTVMASFNSVNGQKVHGDAELLTGLLKEKWGFDGFVVSDWNGIGQIPGCTNSDCAQAINAGIDMVMAPQDWKTLHSTMLRQVRQGVIPMSRIDDAVSRILRVKLRAGLFESGGPANRAQRLGAGVVGSDPHRELAREAVRKSLVMLKNNDRLLPLSPNQRVVVFGEAAQQISAQAGGWSVTWQGTETFNQDFPGATTIYEGIRAAVAEGGGETVYVSADEVETVTANVAVVVFGEPPYAEGEGDLSRLRLMGEAEHLKVMRRLQDRGIKVIAVLLTGRPLWMNAELNAADAFVVAWLPGSEGAGVADVLVGDIKGEARFPFHGVLPFPWPSAQEPIGESGLYPALFPRGYGLTYATSSADLALLPETISDDVSGDEFVIFERRVSAPWRLFLGDRSNWQQPIVSQRQVSAGGALTSSTVDWRVQGDARRLEWSGRGDAQWYVQRPRAVDLQEWLMKEAALEIELAVHEPPSEVVELRVDCSYPCGAKADITRLLRAAPKDQWVRFSLDLQCFKSSGLDLSKVDTMPLLRTRGRLSISVGKVSLIANASGRATIGCSPH